VKTPSNTWRAPAFDVRSLAYESISASGTCALMMDVVTGASLPAMRPRRELRSAHQVPEYSIGRIHFHVP